MPGTKLAFAGTAINAALALFAMAHDAYPPEMGVILVALVILGLFGLMLVAAGYNRLGAALVIASSAPFVPIGLVGVIGGGKILAAARQEAFYAALEA